MSRVFGSDGHGENWQKIIQQKIATLLARADTCIESDEKKNRRKKWTWPTWVTSQESFAPGENLLSPLPLPQHYGHTSSILRDSYWSAERGSCQTSYGWWIKMTFSFFILLPIDRWIATLETTFDVGRWKHGPSVCFCVVTELSHSCDYSVLDSITDTNRCGR